MTVATDIYRVSFPLAAGVLAASFLFACSGFSPSTVHLAAGLSMVVLCAVCALPYLVVKARTGAYIGTETGAGIGVGAGTSSADCSLWRQPAFWIAAFFLTGVFCFCSRAVILPGIGQGNLFAGANASVARLVDSLPFADKENNALLKALVLGDRSGLSRVTTATFRDAGAAHLLALSGMHLGIIYLIAGKVLALAGNSPAARKIRSVAIILLTGLYTLVCGAGASLSRAWLFILLNESAKLLNRRQPPQQIFCAALTIHLILSPESITSIGFQLSYLAMLGIVFVWPGMRKWFGPVEGWEIPFMRRIWDAASLSISCQLFTAPLTLLYFGTFPKFFLLTNLTAAPFMSVVMLSGIAAMALSGFGADAPWLFAALEWPLTMLRQLLAAISALG